MYNQDGYGEKECFLDLLEIGKSSIVNYYDKMESLHLKSIRNQELSVLIGEIKEEFVPLHKDIKDLWSDIKGKGFRSMQEGQFIPFLYLIEIFGLEEFECHCILMALLPELDRRFERIYSLLHEEDSMRLLSIDLADKFYSWQEQDERMESYFTDDSKLVKFFFHTVITKEYSDRSVLLKLRKHVLSFLLAKEWDNTELNPFLTKYIPSDKSDWNDTENQICDSIYHYIEKAKEQKKNTSLCFYLKGIKGIGKKRTVCMFADKSEKAVFFLDTALFHGVPRQEVTFLLNEIIFECTLSQCYVCLVDNEESMEGISEREETFLYLIQKLEEYIPILFFVSRFERKKMLHREENNIVYIPFQLPTRMEGRKLWEQLSLKYPCAPTLVVGDLANRFCFSPGQMKQILQNAHQNAWWRREEYITEDILQECCYREMEHNLGKRASKVNPMYEWKDLILPPYQLEVLHTACSQMKYRHTVYEEWGFQNKMNYGLGLSMIFTGSPGTGKTMAAQVIAKELGLEIYKVELAAVVSKYIGETERNLNEIFEEAEKSQAILFFDEADVLFSKRTEVKDSNDKYSNMEAAFLLQKMEEYAGISILATNYVQNMDDAFRRRIKFMIDFPFPELEYRIKLWESVFPDKMPKSGDIDFGYLAESFEMSGSHIKNTALHAAFLAVASGEQMNMSHIIQAIKNEMTKNGKMLSKEDMGEYYMYLTRQNRVD